MHQVVLTAGPGEQTADLLYPHLSAPKQEQVDAARATIEEDNQ